MGAVTPFDGYRYTLLRGAVKNPFLAILRYLSEGTRLYGRDQPGTTIALFALSIYLPLLLPLASIGVWGEVTTWLERVRVPSPGVLLATYGVVVAIIIALALATPQTGRQIFRAPYPVQRPMKTRIIVNLRLFLIALLGLSTVGVVFTQGMERLEHLVCLALGGLLLQLGHLDEVNAVQSQPVFQELADDPLGRYDRWYAARWGCRPQAEATIRHATILRQHLLAVAALTVLHLAALFGYILLVHGPDRIPAHLPTAGFLCLAAAVITVRAVEAKLHAKMIYRHNFGSGFDSRFAHPETFIAYLLILGKLATEVALAVLPLMWLTVQNRQFTLLYLGWLVLEMLCFGALLVLLSLRWSGRAAAPIRPLSRYDGNYLRYLRRKHAAKQRAAIRGALKYAARHRAASEQRPDTGGQPLPN